MNPREALRLAGTSLRANKMRSVLTLLGVIIGIAAVVAIMSLGKGMQQQLLNDFEQFGLNDVNVQVKTRQTEQDADTWYYEEVPEDSLITAEMVDQLRGFIGPQIQGIALEAGRETAHVTRGLNEGKAGVQFVNADYIEIQNHTITAGRVFTEDDIAGDRAVAVISPEVVEKYFNADPDSAIGANLDVEIGGRYASFQVVGTYGRAAKSSPLVSVPEDALIYVPYTAQSRLAADPVQGFSMMQIRALTPEGTDDVARDVKTWAEQAYADDADYEAKVLDTKSEIDQVNQTMGMISLVISAIGGISLLVGGIGVMNIMLVSVTERTREIGVRMALGATRRAVRAQFVTEAMMICLLGGVIGVLLGTAVGLAVTSMMGTTALPPVSAVLIALLFSLAIGLFFGWYPASRAARMRPIEALRYE